jgi:hypothetical protein
MEFEFIEQRKPEHITVGDKIELFNCEDHHMNGQYLVFDVEQDGEVTLAGVGKKQGVFTVVNFSEVE